MIKYSLQCEKEHQFEGWFSNSADYDVQSEQGLLSCPVCQSGDVEKALMAPSIPRKGASKVDPKLRAFQAQFQETAKKARDYIEKNFDHVGKQFPEEARKIHYGEAPERAIFGEASVEEVKELKEEGVEIAPVPQPLPEPEDIKKKLN